MRQSIIVGIDPGTTTGYAVLDVSGNVIHVSSAKELSLAETIRRITDLGSVLAVGCDKKNTPSFVEKFRIKTGARVITPSKDLLVVEKKELAGTFSVRDSHQSDALASAFFAFRHLRPVLRKVRLFVKREGKEAISQRLFDLVVRKEYGIRYAMDLLEEKETPDRKLVSEAVGKERISKDSFFKLYASMRDKEEEAKRWKERCRILKLELKKARRGMTTVSERLGKEVSSRKKELWNEAWQRKLEKAIKGKKKMEQMIDDQKHLIQRLESALVSKDSFIVIPRIKNLGSGFPKKRPTGKVLFIDDPGIFSQSLLPGLRDLLLVSDKPFPKVIPASTVDSGPLQKKVFSRFVLLKKKALERAKERQGVYKRMVERYQKSRQ